MIIQFINILILQMVLNMGLFTNIFGKSQEKAPTNVELNNGYEADWDSYFTNVDDKYSSIAVDLGLAKIAPVKTQPNVMWVSIKMLNPRSDGLSSQEESTILWEIEDKLVNQFSSKFEMSFVGRLTSDGDRSLYFYIGDSLLYDKIISEVFSSYPKYQYDFGIKEDKNWGGYLDFLYPMPQQMRSIMNRRVIDNLESKGDKLTKDRPVFHWIYFKTKDDRTIFLENIKDQNFKIEKQNTDKSYGEYPFGLQISRTDKVDLESLDEYVLFLWKLAQENNGDYDGWETSVEKE